MSQSLSFQSRNARLCTLIPLAWFGVFGGPALVVAALDRGFTSPLFVVLMMVAAIMALIKTMLLPYQLGVLGRRRIVITRGTVSVMSGERVLASYHWDDVVKIRASGGWTFLYGVLAYPTHLQLAVQYPGAQHPKWSPEVLMWEFEIGPLQAALDQWSGRRSRDAAWPPPGEPVDPAPPS